MAATWTAPTKAPTNNRRALLISLLCGLVAAFLVFRLVSSTQSSSNQTAATVSVVVAKQDIPARTVVQASMLTVKAVPVSLKLPTVLTDPKAGVGLVTRDAISAGEQVLNTKLASSAQALGFAGQVPAGLRGIAVSSDQVTANGGLIQPGDHVDVIAIFQRIDGIPNLTGSFLVKPDETRAKQFVSATIAQNVLVLAVGQDASQPGTGAPSTKAQPDAKSVTLAVSPEDAQRILTSDAEGLIRLTLHRFDDDKSVDINAINNDLPSVLGPDNLPAPITNNVRSITSPQSTPAPSAQTSPAAH